MKYGLLYYKDTDNIGDDIQTYAQKQFLPQVDYLVDRENLGCFLPNQKEYVSVIMNAWYIHNKAAWPPSPYINPLLTSMHFSVNKRLNGGDDYIRGIGAEYLKKYGPVGCRDEETVKRLEGNGIHTYFSGCMTLTIKPFENLEKKDYICVVDVENEIVEKVRLSTNREIKVITHKVKPEDISQKAFEDRMKDVEELLKIYQQAHLVVTSRLHTMLPCVAMGTPVILIHKKEYEKDRLETFLKYVNSYIDTEFLSTDISDALENPIENNKEYLEITNNLNHICNEFVEKSKNQQLFIENELPSIEEYKEKIKLKEYYMNLYEKSWRQSLSNIFEMDGYYKQLIEQYKKNEELQKELIEKQEKIDNLESENNRTEKELISVRESKTYRIACKIRNFIKHEHY